MTSQEGADRPTRAVGSRALPWIAWVSIGVLQCLALGMFFTQPSPAGAVNPGSIMTFFFAPALNASLGLLILSRRPGHLVGWLFMGMAASFATAFALQEYAVRALITAPRSLPFGRVMASLLNPVGSVITLVIATLLMVFPTGTFLGKRWRRFAIAGGIGVVATTAAAALGDSQAIGIFRDDVEFGTGGLGLIHDPEGRIAWIASFPTLIAAAAGLTSPIVRYRRARGAERDQIKLVAWTLIVGVALLVLSGWSPPLPDNSNTIAGAVMILGLPISVSVAVLRHGLLNIDFVISKTIVYAALAAFVTAVYIGIVVGLGTVIGSRGNIALSIAATALVAVAFQPARERMQHVANRVVYGERATPFEVLTRLSEQVSATLPAEDVLQRVAKALADGTGAARAEVIVGTGTGAHRGSIWPPDAKENATDLIVPATHQGIELGAIAIAKAPGEQITETDRRLAADVAGHVGLVLRNVGLDADLLAKMEELRESRQRLVKAQDEERRRLERDLHDGAQQHLVALKVNLGIALTTAADDPAKEFIEQMQADTGEALETLRDLARGIYPPLLASDGLATALRSRAAKAPIPVRVESDDIGRFPQELEAAVYFCVLEALQNAAKYARPSEVVVSLARTGADLTFTVADDGAGFDPDAMVPGAGLTNMTDRLAAVDGAVSITSAVGRGTVVQGRIPVATAERAR